MRKNPRRILSPQRLPFRHPGSGHSNLANTKGQRNTSEESMLQGLAERPDHASRVQCIKRRQEEHECPVNVALRLGGDLLPAVPFPLQDT